MQIQPQLAMDSVQLTMISRINYNNNNGSNNNRFL